MGTSTNHTTFEAKRRTPSTDRWVKPFFKRYRSALILALMLGVLTFIFASALMFSSGYLISKAAEAPGNIMVIFVPVALVRIFGVGKPILQYLERLKSHDWVLRMTSSLRLKLYQSLETRAVFFKQHYKTGDILGLLAEDIGHLQNLYLRSVFPTIVAWALCLILVVCFGYFSLWFALVMLLLLGVVVVLFPLVSVLVNGARQTKWKVQKNALYRDLTDNVLGVSDWIISQRGQDYLNNYHVSETKLRELTTSMNRFARIRDLLLQLFFGIIIVAIFLWAGSTFGGSYAGPANWIAAFALGFFPLIDAFAPLSQAATETGSYRSSITRLNELPESKTSEEMHAFPASSARTSQNQNAPIAIRELSFRYPQSSKQILHGINLSIAPGEKIAILGRSGAGKTTLASLLRGDLSPTSGHVKIQEMPAAEYGDDISSVISVIQQQTYLFNMTLADNLRIGNTQARDDELWSALEKVELKEMVERLPAGLETMVDEAGLRFSGGERHRIALARVLLKNTPIVILDEPTVGLDPLTEQALLRTLFEALADKTVVLITHHLQGVSLMDRVVFIENGTLRLSGTPAELEKESPFYRQLLEFDKGIISSAE